MIKKLILTIPILLSTCTMSPAFADKRYDCFQFGEVVAIIAGGRDSGMTVQQAYVKAQEVKYPGIFKAIELAYGELKTLHPIDAHTVAFYYCLKNIDYNNEQLQWPKVTSTRT